jgi:4-carboxymuconolactone decarboxylase
LTDDELTPEQRTLHDAIAKVRDGAVRGPFAIWLRIPAVADGANQLGNALRLAGALDRRLFELAVLVVARHWSAQYEWYVHAKAARAAGLAPAVIESIRTGREPAFAAQDEAVVYAASTELLHTKALSAETYGRAREVLGREPLIELVSVLGFYTMAAMTLTAFDVPVPGGDRPLDL